MVANRVISGQTGLHARRRHIGPQWKGRTYRQLPHALTATTGTEWHKTHLRILRRWIEADPNLLTHNKHVRLPGQRIRAFARLQSMHVYALSTDSRFLFRLNNWTNQTIVLRRRAGEGKGRPAFPSRTTVRSPVSQTSRPLSPSKRDGTNTMTEPKVMTKVCR